MKKYGNSNRIAIASFFILANSAFANSGTFLSGIGHAQYTQNITTKTAGTFGLEGGPRNVRASATLGWAITPCDRIKATGEWLGQDINYEFISGNAIQNSNQGAAGLAYQHAFNDEYQDHFNLSAYYSHARSINLRNRDILPPSADTGFLLMNNFRHISGSKVGGASAGYTTSPWEDTDITVSGNWDGVDYDKQYNTKSYIHGFGATANLNQFFTIRDDNFKAGTTVAWRAPFNSYQLEFDWIKPFSYSELSVGIFGSYIQGKHALPNTSLAGLNIIYALDTAAPKNVTLRPFMEWMKNPAVYMPQVLSVPDQAVARRVLPIT